MILVIISLVAVSEFAFMSELILVELKCKGKIHPARALLASKGWSLESLKWLFMAVAAQSGTIWAKKG